MSVQSLRASLELFNTTPGAESSFNAPSRMAYHQTARDVMLIQGIHYALEEALANVGELGSSNPLLDPRRRCLLRLQQNLIDIARISENIQESMLRSQSSIISQASTSQAPIIEEEPTPQLVTEDFGNVLLPATSIPARPCIKDSGELIIFPLPCRSDAKPRAASPPSENLTYQVRDNRSKRKTPADGDHFPHPPPAKRPRLSPNASVYLRPTHQKRDHSSVFSWASWMFAAPKK